MTARIESGIKQSKQAASHINKFNYHVEHTLPAIFETENKLVSDQSSPILWIKRGIRNMNFHFAEHLTEGVGTIDAEAIMLSAMKVYVGSDCVKLSQSSFKKSKTIKAAYLPIYGVFNEILEFCIIDNNEAKPSTTFSKWAKKQKQTPTKLKDNESEVGLSKSGIKKNLSHNYELYVIHHCHSQGQQKEQLKWENFVERYHFREEMDNGQLLSKIHYRLLFNYEVDQGLLNLYSYRQKMYQNYIRDHCSIKDGELHNISQFQGYLLQDKDRVSKKMMEMNDPAFDESQKKWLKLSPEYFKMFTVLKKQAMAKNKQVNSDRQCLAEQIVSSLTYRYMVAKEFNFKQSFQNIMFYFSWQKELSQNYNLIMFERFHKIDFYTYLGHDFEGRCVILNKASNLLVDKIDSVDDYCKYFCYYLEVFIPRKLRGYASQYSILADLQGLCSDNFKLAITKRNIHEGTTYLPQRQYKFFAVNVNSWATSLWKIIKHLLPKRTVSKVNILGTNQNQIIDVLVQEMDISVIPEYLGGTNKRIHMDDLKDERQFLAKKQQ